MIIKSIKKCHNHYKTYGSEWDKKTLLLRGGVFLYNRLTNNSNYDKLQSYLTKKLTEEYKDLIDTYKHSNVCNKENTSKNIWTCWLQGKENMPPVAKRCHETICKNFKDYNIHLITSNNYMEYIEIPKHILNKVNKGLITKTTFSDILRIKLLKEYGGYWMDSTLYSTSNKTLPKTSFSTIKSHYRWPGRVSDGWCTYFLGGSKNNILFDFLDECFTKYFKDHDRIFDYFLIDYFIRIAYENIDYVKNVIDNMKYNNENVEDLVKYFNCPFDSKIYDELKSSNQFFKFTFKKEFTETNDGKDTFYKKLIIDGI